ncbi:MAG: LytTR family DNA-binding domain-containing protein [Chitinophagales bacterium]|nr:LytTR family DNA-binding domain-containing protein [Chitinophagales bacterium]
MVKCIVIDDEPKARNLLKSIIEQYCPILTIEALCEDLPSGVKAIKKHKPQLIFLDIEMPGHSGLELMDFFNDNEVDFSIIFTTAYNEYALQAFRFSAIDYLLKPIQHNQLVEAVERYSKKHHQNQSDKLRTLQENLSINKDWDEKRIVVPSGQSMHFIKPVDIIMIKGEAAYSELHLINGTTMLASKNLKHFEEMLSAIPFFLRSHKSYIVNTRAVLQYVKSDGGYLKLKNDLTALISSDKVDEFLSLMG